MNQKIVGFTGRNQSGESKFKNSMKTTKNTVLITGGSAGIGFEIARSFASNGNHVIITGRDKTRLHHAASELPNVTPIVGDVTRAEQVDELVNKIEKNFPTLNVVINNAGKAWLHNLSEDNGSFEKSIGGNSNKLFVRRSIE